MTQRALPGPVHAAHARRAVGVSVRERSRRSPTRFPSDTVIVAAGRCLRDLHDESTSSSPSSPSLPAHRHDDVATTDGAGSLCASAPQFFADEVSGLTDGDLIGTGAPLQDLALVALALVPLTTRDGTAGVPAPADHARRLRLLLDSYGWDGDERPVVAAARETARQHAVWLRQSAARRYEPAILQVADGVAADFDRAVAALDEDLSRRELLGAGTR